MQLNLPKVPTVGKTEFQPRMIYARRFKILKQGLEAHGYTVGCAGCNAARQNRRAPHSEECRDRISLALGGQGDARIMREVESYAENFAPTVPPDTVPEDEPTPMDDEEMKEEDKMMLQLTGDVHEAKKLSNWSNKIQAQWLKPNKCWSDGVHAIS